MHRKLVTHTNHSLGIISGVCAPLTPTSQILERKSNRLRPGSPPRPRSLRPFARACLTLVVSSLALLFSPSAASGADPATILFALDFPNSDPAHYSISVTSDGHARYECVAKPVPDSEEREPYTSEFDFSPANRARIFDLAAQARYFSGKLDSGHHKVAFTGAKKLVYRDSQHTYSADYNYSDRPSVQQLTALFQNVAATLEYGRRMVYYHRYQKLALDDELKRMEAQARSNELNELEAVQPVLQEIFDDNSVINVVRARAQRLIEMGKAANSTGR
jgi:hypothetical protein